MKMFFSSLALILSVLALSGCSTCGKKSACTNCSSVVPPPVETVAAPVVAAPVVPQAVTEAAPVVEKKMTEEQIMRAVSK